MDLSYSNINLFPSVIQQFDVNDFDEMQNQLIDYVYKMREKDPVGNSISNRGGWQSKSFSVVNEDDILHLFLINYLSEFLAIKKSVSIKADAWVNINKPGDYNVKHNHPFCNLAGVLWIKCSENCGNIEFENPNLFQTYMESSDIDSKKKGEIDYYTNDFNIKSNIYPTYYFNPTEGRMIVFPSYLYHYVQENKSNQDRISVSFNIRLD